MKCYKFTLQSIGAMPLSAFAADPKSGIIQVDINVSKKLVRIVADHCDQDTVIAWARKKGMVLRAYEQCVAETSILGIGGMTCRSCEVTLERELGKIEGVQKVSANAARGSVNIVHSASGLPQKAIQETIHSQGYKLLSIGKIAISHAALPQKRPSFGRLVGFFVLAFAFGLALDRFNLLSPSAALGDSVSLGAVFILGLFAASSSCIAVSGGLLLSSAARWNAQYGTLEGWGRMQPVLFFIVGRVMSYLLFGALIGFIGQSLSPSPLVTGLITLCAALFMIIMGLDMLGYAPQWLKGIVPHMPKKMSHAILNKESSQFPLAPLLFGGATFFLPCGFTQSLQLYALTTGSAVTSALLLAVFALGTAPALFGLGWASTSLKGKAGTFFFQFSGVIVLLLGVWNMQNGFTAAGYPLSFPSIAWSSSTVQTTDKNVIYDGNIQTVRMTAGSRGYTPSRFTVRAGIPVKWIVDGTNAEGCVSVFQAPQLGIKKLLSRGDNVFEFTPDKPGTYAFSCSMGMYRGAITVVPNT